MKNWTKHKRCDYSCQTPIMIAINFCSHLFILMEQLVCLRGVCDGYVSWPDAPKYKDMWWCQTVSWVSSCQHKCFMRALPLVLWQLLSPLRAGEFHLPANGCSCQHQLCRKLEWDSVAQSPRHSARHTSTNTSSCQLYTAKNPQYLLLCRRKGSISKLSELQHQFQYTLFVFI